MEAKYLDTEIERLNLLERNHELTDWGKEMLSELKEIKKALLIPRVMDRLPESDYIRQQAQQMDEKEFDQWWWETVYKGN
jgi:hypothetical protein